MQLASRPLPLAELASVRRAVERVSLVACNRTERCGRHAPVLLTRAASDVAHDGEDAADAPPARRPTASSSKGGGKGFGSPSKPPSQKQQQPSRRDKVFEEEMEAEEQATGPAAVRPEYQLYSDDQFKPKRYIGNVQVTTVEGKGRVLVASVKTEPGDLLMLLPALAFLEGELFTAPEPEDLHVALLEEGLTAPQRRVLDLLNDGSGEVKQATVTTLDTKFWGARGNNDPSAPTIDAKRLMNIITNCCFMDTQQDTAVMQVRQQAPAGYIGLWPEASLIAHSCVPNTSMVVIKDRMMLHAADYIKIGDLLTRNCIGADITQPLAARQAAVQESRGYKCDCPRCKTEESVSEGMRQTLEEAYSWYAEEAMPQWNASQEREDLEALKELYSEAEQIVNEVEEAIQAEPGLSEDQQMWLRCAVYDCYDLLVMCDEFLNPDRSNIAHLRACLELIRLFAPGSESHTAVALHYDTSTRTRAELAEAYAAQQLKASSGGGAAGGRKKGRMGSLKKAVVSPEAKQAARYAKDLRDAAEEASEFYMEAFCTRYGLVGHQQLDLLREGLEMYHESIEQMSVMQAEGKTEMSTDYMIDGVRFTLTDKLGPSTGADEEGGYEQVGEVENKDGVKVMFVQGPQGEGGVEEEEEGDEEGDDVEAAEPQAQVRAAKAAPAAGGLASAARRRQGKKMQRGPK